MTITELIELAENRLQALGEEKLEFERIGDAEGVMRCENEISETDATLARLRSA